MINIIGNQIENINKSLGWIKKNKPGDYDQKFLMLVDERRKLRKLKEACKDNPAIAAYGVSQVGKSYLMNCILQNGGKPFLIKADGRFYNFIEEMNPKTDNTEATGVVTRFSSFAKDPKRYSEEYPILMKCLSITDVILVLSDGYYNDISDYTTYSEVEITEKAQDIYNKYINMPVIDNSPIKAEDILDIRLYYSKHVNNAQAFLHTSFFDLLSLVVDRIPETDWISVFPLLWHESEYQTRLFSKMLNTLSKFEFSQYVYLPAQALLHDGNNENTVMSVQCLNELFLTSPRYFTDGYIRKGDKFTKVEKLTKSEVCAVCAEIIVKIGDDYLENTSSYCMNKITDPKVQNLLSANRKKVVVENKESHKSEVYYESKISILKENDLLDFPGARSRKKESLMTLQEDAILVNVLLRGKVAYLFNMYNESMLINILLYCHHAAQNDVTDIPLLLNDWIQNYVGDTMEKRRKTLELTDGISPLFYIGTKFNIDMQEKPEEIANGLNSLNGRWQQRFEKVLYHQCFNADGSLDSEKNKIFLNWTREGECFNNSYILRDFKFSGPLVSKLYDHEKTDHSCMTISQSYYENMRDTFCSNEAVKRFFPFPELSWDVCASINNDGALYIIEQLGKVASKMGETRDEQFKSILASATRHILQIIDGYFVSTDVDEILENNIHKAKAIFREMDFTCNSDNYYFGHLIQALQLTEAESYRVIHEVVQSPELNESVNAFKDYEIIRSSCAKAGYPLDSAKSESEKMKCIIDTYGFVSEEDAGEYLQHRNIDKSKLFSGSYTRKLNSCIIADAIYDRWCTKIKSVDFLNEFSTKGNFDSNILGSLVEELILSADILDLRDRMAESIAEYVNVIDVHAAHEDLIADMLANRINEYILDFGYSLLSEKEKMNAKRVCEQRNIPAFKCILNDDDAVLDEQGLTELFNEMYTNPTALLPSFEQNYNRWLEYMFISFVVHLDIPDYDVEENRVLQEILENIKAA